MTEVVLRGLRLGEPSRDARGDGVMELLADDWQDAFCASGCKGAPEASPMFADAGSVGRRGPLLLVLLILAMLVVLGVIRGVTSDEVDRACHQDADLTLIQSQGRMGLDHVARTGRDDAQPQESGRWPVR